jgi:hypothetical protein
MSPYTSQTTRKVEIPANAMSLKKCAPNDMRSLEICRSSSGQNAKKTIPTSAEIKSATINPGAVHASLVQSTHRV